MSSPSRNTLNQRLSRQRRKSYISQLEKRIRTYEVEGVKATADVQRAARRVVEENQMLRRVLLEHFGARVEQDGQVVLADRNGTDFKSRLAIVAAAGGQGVNQVREETIPFAGVDFQARHLQPAARARTGRSPDSLPLQRPSQIQSVPQPAAFLSTTNFITTMSNTASVLKLSGGPDHNRSTSSSIPKSQRPTSPPLQRCIPSSTFEKSHPYFCCDRSSSSSSSSSSPPPPPQPNTTPCEEAALIIASMRGLERPSEVFHELGCSETTRCDVDNVALFSMLDGS